MPYKNEATPQTTLWYAYQLLTLNYLLIIANKLLCMFGRLAHSNSGFFQ